MVFGMRGRPPKVVEPIEEKLPEADDEEEDVNPRDYDKKIAEIDEKLAALNKVAGRTLPTKEAKEEFKLDEEEAAMAVNALASSEEFKIYQQNMIGQKIAGIIYRYNKAVKEDEK